MVEPENLTLQILRKLDSKMDNGFQELKSEIGALRKDINAEINSLRADVASDLILTRKETSEQVVGLRRAVIEYHSSVIGHGIIISELEGRVRRLEQHLNLPHPEPH